MPEQGPKDLRPADHPPPDRAWDSDPDLSAGHDRGGYPEAFGRATPLAPPDAFGRGEGGATPQQPTQAAPQAGDEPHAHPESPPRDDAPPKPPFHKRPVPMTIILVLVLAALAGGLLYWLHARRFETTDDAFIAGHITRIAPRVAGQVTRVLVNDNQDVQAGDLLVEIDPRDLQVRVAQAQADLTAAQGRLAEAQANAQAQQAALGQAQAAEVAAVTEAERTTADLKRYEALDERAVSRQQLDQVRATARTAAANLDAARKKTVAARAQVELARAQVDTAQASVKEAQAALEQAKLYLGYTRINAPEAGRVANKTVEPGAYVQTGQALFSLVPRDVWVVANYKETQITDMRVGQHADVDVDAYPHHTFAAHVDSFQAGSGAAFSLLPPENATGNYVKVVQRVPVKIVFDDPPDDRYLLGPGMSVTPRVNVR